MTTVGILLTGPQERLEADYIAPFRSALSNLLGQSAVRYLPHAPRGAALNEPDEMQRHAAELIAQKPDVIWLLSTSTAIAALKARDAAHETANIPIVGAAVSSRIRTQPSALLDNFTGIINSGWELGDERFRLLDQIMKDRLRTVGVLVHPHPYNDSSVEEFKLIEQAAKPKRAVSAAVRTPGEVGAGIEKLKKDGADAVMTTHIPLFQHEREEIMRVAAAVDLPVVGHRSFFADAGALMTYSSVLSTQMEQSAEVVHKMLSPGAEEASFEQPREFELIVNAEAAQHFGLSVPARWRFLHT